MNTPATTPNAGPAVHGQTLDTFTRAYIECALWSSTGDNDQPLDRDYSTSDIAPEALARIIADCAKFQSENADAIRLEFERAGHDFWLTRNGHGAGFWDGDWLPPHGSQLDLASKAFGTCDLYVGDDGQLYIA